MYAITFMLKEISEQNPELHAPACTQNSLPKKCTLEPNGGRNNFKSGERLAARTRRAKRPRVQVYFSRRVSQDARNFNYDYNYARARYRREPEVFVC